MKNHTNLNDVNNVCCCCGGSIRTTDFDRVRRIHQMVHPGQAYSTEPGMNRVQLIASIDVLSRAIPAWEMYAQFTEDLFLYDFAVQHIARMERELTALRKELACFSPSSTP